MQACKRKSDWETAFVRVVSEAENTPYRWGTHDCALFVCDVILAMTGVDLAAEFRGKYHGRAEGRRILRRFCGELSGLAEAVAGQFGIAEVPPLCARRGDVVLVDAGPRVSLGMVSLDGWNVLLAGQEGILTAPLSMAVRAWRIG